MSCCGINFFTRIRIRIGIRTICNFATRRFRTLLGSLMPINGPISIAIVSRPQISLHKRWTQHFSGDTCIIDRSVMYPMGWPFCFRGDPNNNVLLTLLILHVLEILHAFNFRTLWLVRNFLTTKLLQFMVLYVCDGYIAENIPKNIFGKSGLFVSDELLDISNFCAQTCTPIGLS